MTYDGNNIEKRSKLTTINDIQTAFAKSEAPS